MTEQTEMTRQPGTLSAFSVCLVISVCSIAALLLDRPFHFFKAAAQAPTLYPSCVSKRPIPIDHWRGEYFNNRELKGSPVMVRDDGSNEIYFDWGLASPSTECNVNVDQFSARWTRIDAFAAGVYRFTMTSDDGVRLLIDGQEKFSAWQDRPLTTNTIDVVMGAGNHKIVLEYFENFGSAVVKLSWEQHPCVSNVPPDHWRGEYFSNDNLSGQPVMIRDDGDPSLAFEWPKNPDPACLPSTGNVAARWTRKVAFGGGLFRFEISSDAGIRLSIDGQLRFDRWRNQPPIEGHFDAPMEAGNHTLIIEYHTPNLRSGPVLRWRPLPCLDNVPENHWRGEYFNSDNLSGQPVMVRDDGDSFGLIDFNWGNDSPAPGCRVRPDSFSVRWTGALTLDAGFHRFTLTANGGVRLSINGQVKIDQWTPKLQKQTFDVALDAGRHQIVLEYADFGGKASVRLTRQPPPCITTVDSEHWKGEYFNNKNLSGSPSLVRDDGTGTIDFDWGLNTPNRDCLGSSDNFSIRWSRNVNFAAGTYRFTAAGDDGLRLFVDGKKLIDEWHDQLAAPHTTEIELSEGFHRIVLEYYENVGSASVKLSWAVAPCTAVVPIERWKGEYFNNANLSGRPILVRDDGAERLNFDWGLKGPDSNCGLNIDNFSVRWTRVVTFSEGIFRFAVTADDGVRVYIDQQLKFESWVDQMAARTFDVQLAAGNHQMTVEYYEHWGSATIKLAWEQHPCFSTVLPDHWRGEYFNNPHLNGQAVMIRDEGDGYLDFDWQVKSPNPGCNLTANDFSARWSRNVVLAAGSYRFTVTGDDGVRLFVDGKKVIDQWRQQEPTTYTADLKLPVGTHRIILEYYQRTGQAIAKLSWDLIGNQAQSK